MRKPNKDIQLTTYQDLLGVEENMGAGTEKIVIAPLIELFDFKDHPFKVLDDEKMEETTESIVSTVYLFQVSQDREQVAVMS